MSLKPTQKSDCTEFDMTDEAPYNSCCFTIVTIEKTAYMCYPGTDNEIDDQYKTTLDTYATNYSYDCTRDPEPEPVPEEEEESESESEEESESEKKSELESGNGSIYLSLSLNFLLFLLLF